MRVPERMNEATAAQTAICLKLNACGTPAAFTLDAQGRPVEELWALDGFELTAARYFLDNFLEPLGYAPIHDGDAMWLPLDSREKLRE